MAPAQLEDQYRHAKITRDADVVTVAFHTDGSELRWGSGPHEEIPRIFHAIAHDPSIAVVIMTGTGNAFCQEFDRASIAGMTNTPLAYDVILREGTEMLENHLDIRCPTIGVVNGPARIHAELLVMCDIVLAASDSVFQDAAHFANGVVPGDGVHVIWPLILGQNRGRYFLLTGQELTAQEALTAGVVSEVLASDKLMPRARELAAELALRPPLALRYTRECITAQLKHLVKRDLPHGFALEALNSIQLDGWRMRDG